MDTLKVFLLSLFLLLVSCRSSNDNSINNEWDLKEFQNGDIIYRHGNGFFSDYFRKSSNREQLYSHGGIIVIDSSRVYVIHSEASEFTGIGGVRKESLNIFLKNVSTWGVYRLDTAQTVRDSVAYIANRYLNRKTPFDLDFDNGSDDKVYCTELIAISVNNAVHRDLIKPTGTIRNKHYYAIDDTYLIKEMKPVIRK